MKVVSITMVKNEVDIIESFIRYHLNIVDKMIILDNCSSDETPLIISKLIDEGLPIIFFTDSNNNFTQAFKLDTLLHDAFNEHDADIVCVLDADEFLISSDNNANPREILNNLDLNEYYLAKWMTYVPTKDDSPDLFIPKRITHVRDENLEFFFKVIVTKGIFNSYSPKLEMGNHDLSFPNVKNPPKSLESTLKIAHFPIRSAEQCISKVSVAWPSIVSINPENKPWGWHWKDLFEKIKSNKYITADVLENFAKYYALNDFENEIKITNQPINLGFCKNILIKYYFTYNSLRNILDSYEQFSKQPLSFKRLFEGNSIPTLNWEYEVIKNSKLFDEEWYRKTYSLKDDVNPIVHYLITWREDMNDPAGFFSTEFYLKKHVDVANDGMNPFVHYIIFGKKENRKIAPSQHADIKISIVIPIYNVESYLNQCLYSVLSQDFADFEVICVCDGSTDNSLNILESYAQSDSRVKVISQNNNGPGNARNVGLRHAIGKYVLFVDSDDFLSKNSLSQIYNNAESNQSDIVMFDFYQFDELNDKCDRLGCHLNNIFVDKDLNSFTFSYKDIKKHVLNSFFNCWFKLYRKSFLDRFNMVFPENICYEDVIFHVKSLVLADSISFCPDYAYNYRFSNQNSIMSDKSKIFDIIDVVNSVESFLNDEGIFEEFEVEFYTFKINQLSQYIRFWGDSDYFNAVKKEFVLMNDSSEFDFNRLKEPVKATFDKILKSEDEFEFMDIEYKYGNFSKTQVKVSCVMPVYNCEDFLVDSLNSILNQSFEDFELICVDDGSSDNSLKILRDFEKKDSRMKVFSLSHEGGGNARNFAIKYVQGEYLYFMDADDILDLNAFEDFYSISKSKNLDFLMFKAKTHNVETDEYSETDYYNMTKLSKFVGDKIFNFKDLGELIFSINVTPWCKFYNTEFIINSGAKFRENSKFHDNNFFWDIIFQAERIMFLDEFYYTHNIHSKSLIQSGSERHIDSIYVANDINNLFIKHNQFDKFKVDLFNRKVYHNIRRYDEIQDQFKGLYFTELKKDFKLLKYTDFRNNLYSHNKFFFDCVLIAKNYEEFNYLKAFSKVLTDNQLSQEEKIKKYKEWYDSLEEDYKQLFYNDPKSMNIYNYLVSVIIPTYNSESFIKNAFNSLLNQTIGFEKLEVIFVDDASDDNTFQIIDEFAKNYENVISIHLEENSGFGGKPRNVGMDYSTADYLMFLDSDDLFFEDACEILYDEITTENIDIVSGVVTKDGINVNPGFWENILTDPEDSYENRFNKVKKLVTENFTLKINNIDEYESVIANFGFYSKIYRKSFLLKNNICFPESTVAQDSVFLLNALLNADGIKFINKLVYHYVQRMENGNASISHTITKKSMINRLDAYFQMFLICLEKNKSRIFKKFLLFDKLNYFINFHVLKCNLSISDLLDVLVHATSLFRLYVDYNPNLNIDNASLFKYIANKDYENALKEIYGSEIKNQKDIKVAVSSDNFSKDSFNYESKMFELCLDSWLEQIESEKPDIFLFNGQNRNDEILDYCNEHNIQAVQWDGSIGNLDDLLDSINFKYVPDLKHLVIIYSLNDLKELNNITNHFYSINCQFKHLKIITTKENLFLNNAILESDLDNLDFDDNYYYCFADWDFDLDSLNQCENLSKFKNAILNKNDFKKVIFNNF